MVSARMANLLLPLQAAWRTLRRRRLLMLALALWLAWLVLSALLVPWWLRTQLPGLLQPYGMQLRMERVRFNPFTLAVTARGINLQLNDNTPLLTLQELRLNLALTLLRRAVIGFDEIALVQPQITLQLRADGSSNWQQLAAGFASDQPEPVAAAAPAELPRLLLQRFELSGGALQLDDFRFLSGGHHSRIDGLGITLNDISTLRDEHGQYHVRGSLPGTGEFAWRGSVALNPLISSGELSLEKVELTPLAPLLLPDPGALQGTLDWQAQYQFRRLPLSYSFQLYDSRLSVRDFRWQLPGEAAPRLSWPALTLDGITLDTDARKIGVKTLSWTQPELAIARDEFGALRGLPTAAGANSATASVSGTVPTPTPVPESDKSSEAWTLSLAAVQVAELAAHIDDDSRLLPVSLQVAGVNLATALSVDLADAAVSLNGLQLSIAEVTLRERAANAADTESTAQSDASDAAAAPQAAPTGAELAPLVQLKNVELADASVATATRQFSASRIGLGAARVVVTRQANGDLWPLSHLAERNPSEEETPPWQYQIQQLSIADLLTQFTDASNQPAAHIDLTVAKAELGPLAEPATSDTRLALHLTVPPNASVNLDGTLSADKNTLTAKLELARLPLALAEPYLRPHLHASIASGSVSSRGNVALKQLTKQPTVRYQGTASIDQFDLRANQTSLLGWQQLKANGLRFDSAPLALSIDQLIWQKPVATLHFAADGSNNFSSLQPAAVDASAAAAQVAKPVAPAAQPSEPSALPVQLRVKRLDLIDGALDFADARLVLPYRANIQQFNGSVVGLASDAGSRATVALEGKVDSYGQAQLSGDLQPLAPTAWLDLTLAFRNVALAPFTPYSATFAGRKITDGILTMDLRYRIENGQLLGDNRVVLDRFTLGEPIESPDAWSLPLDLAIAVLKDSDGRIDLAMPVEGNVNDPEFRYGRVVWQALVNVLTKIVTAPFKALASLFGSDAEELEAIVFAPGRSDLSPPEQEKLDKLLGMVSQRPDLQLIVFGQYDEALDRPALQALALRRELSAALGQTVQPGSQPAPIGLGDADSQIALETLYDARFGAEARATLLQQHNAKRSQPHKTANRLLSTFGGGAGDAEWYRVLQTELETQQPLPVDALQQLAMQRAAGIELLLASKLAAKQWQRQPVQPVADEEENAVMMGLGLAALPALSTPTPATPPAPNPTPANGSP